MGSFFGGLLLHESRQLKRAFKVSGTFRGKFWSIVWRLVLELKTLRGRLVLQTYHGIWAFRTKRFRVNRSLTKTGFCGPTSFRGFFFCYQRPRVSSKNRTLRTKRENSFAQTGHLNQEPIKSWRSSPKDADIRMTAVFCYCSNHGEKLLALSTGRSLPISLSLCRFSLLSFLGALLTLEPGAVPGVDPKQWAKVRA